MNMLIIQYNGVCQRTIKLAYDTVIVPWYYRHSSFLKE